MQTPCKTLGGRVARELYLLIPMLLVTAGLWMGCGKDNSSEPADKGGGADPAPQAKTGPAPSSQPEVKPVTNPAPQPAAGERALTSHLPAEMTLLFSANLQQLLDKGGHKEFLKSAVFEEMKAAVDDELALAILKDPAASGLDVAQPMHVFVNLAPPAEEFGEPLVTGGLVAAVKNADALEAMVAKVIQATGMPLGITPAKGYQQVALPGLPFAMGFSDRVLVMIGTNDEAQALQVPVLLEARMNAQTEPQPALAKHLKKNYDVAAWVDYGQLMAVVGDALGGLGEDDPFMALTQELYEEMNYSFITRFDPGAMVMELGASFGEETNKQFAKMGGPGAAGALLDLVPANTIAAFAESINMAELRKFFNQELLPVLKKNPEINEVLGMMEEEIGLTLEDLLSIPKGDFLLSWDSLGMVEGDFGPTPQVGFLLGITVDNWKAANKLINNPELQEGMTMLKSTLGIQFAQNQQALFLTSAKHANAVAEGKAPNPIQGARRDLIGKHVAGGFLRFGQMAKVLEKLAEDMGEAEEAAMVIKTIRKFDDASFTSNMFDMKAKLTFKNKETNSLKQIVDLSVELAKMMEPSEEETEGFEEEDLEELLEEPEGIEIEPELEEIAPRKK